MRLYKKAKLHGTLINITPLIDVILLLIIFFMTVSHIAQTEIELLDLPESAQADTMVKEEQKRVIINIHADGVITVFGKDLSLEQIREVLKEEKIKTNAQDIRVLIRADRTSEWEIIKKVLTLCREENLRRIRVAVLEKIS